MDYKDKSYTNWVYFEYILFFVFETFEIDKLEYLLLYIISDIARSTSFKWRKKQLMDNISNINVPKYMFSRNRLNLFNQHFKLSICNFYSIRGKFIVVLKLYSSCKKSILFFEKCCVIKNKIVKTKRYWIEFEVPCNLSGNINSFRMIKIKMVYMQRH